MAKEKGIQPTPGPRPAPKPAPRPSVDCTKVQAEAAKLTQEGYPEIAKFLLGVTGCAPNVVAVVIAVTCWFFHGCDSTGKPYLTPEQTAAYAQVAQTVVQAGLQDYVTVKQLNQPTPSPSPPH